MEWKTHMLTGVVAGYAVTGGDWTGAIVGGISAIIPDLDEPKSTFGKLLFPLSIILNRIFGHRTFTHSLLFVLLVGGFVSLSVGPLIGLAAASGVMAHILGDMVTGKVLFLYPKKISIGIPGSTYFFLVNDRICRFAMMAILLVIGWQELTVYL